MYYSNDDTLSLSRSVCAIEPLCTRPRVVNRDEVLTHTPYDVGKLSQCVYVTLAVVVYDVYIVHGGSPVGGKHFLTKELIEIRSVSHEWKKKPHQFMLRILGKGHIRWDTLLCLRLACFLALCALRARKKLNYTKPEFTSNGAWYSALR